MIDFTIGAPIHGDLDVRWIHGAPRGQPCGDPAIQVHGYDQHTWVLRQSKATNYEAPFLYLFFGNARALLLDTGATRDPAVFPLRATIDGLLADWLELNPRDGYQLIVAHTHAHGDHVAGDGQFDGRPDTTVVGHQAAAVREFFGFTGWPDQIVRLDLGGRALEVTGIPGHQAASIAVHDPWSGFLLTGDTVYPGRLYVPDFPAFAASLERLADLASSRQVTHVMGGHIEMTRTLGRDYPIGTKYQPDEPPLQMTGPQLLAVRDAARSIAARSAAGRAGPHVFDDFIIFNGPYQAAVFSQRVRTAWRGMTRRVPG